MQCTVYFLLSPKVLPTKNYNVTNPYLHLQFIIKIKTNLNYHYVLYKKPFLYEIEVAHDFVIVGGICSGKGSTCPSNYDKGEK